MAQHVMLEGDPLRDGSWAVGPTYGTLGQGNPMPQTVQAMTLSDSDGAGGVSCRRSVGLDRPLGGQLSLITRTPDGQTFGGRVAGADIVPALAIVEPQT